MKNSLDTAVALIIFNRPDTTERVFSEIAKAKPKKLFVIADGPRPDKLDDAKKCSAARAVIERVDWDCEVLKNYADVNLGCGYRPASGISWVFGQVEDAIILEDDCVPHPSFFPFCAELLERYRHDKRVMHICGSNFLSNPIQTPFSYYFSVIPNPHGWATWRRAWRYYDFECKIWPLLKDTRWLAGLEDDDQLGKFLAGEFERAYNEKGNIGTWDYQWLFAILANNGLSILSKQNLISNIGFHEDATHTSNRNDLRANMPTVEMEFPLKHPPYALPDRVTDRLFINEVLLPGMYEKIGFYPRVRKKFFNLMQGLNKRVRMHS